MFRKFDRTPKINQKALEIVKNPALHESTKTGVWAMEAAGRSLTFIIDR